jgi:hypothetical protein
VSFDFSPETKYESPNSLVPNGALAFVIVKVRGFKNSTETRGEYADIELVLTGQHENRRVFAMIANPTDERNSEKWRQMGMAAVQHICEAAGIFKPDQPESYKRFANSGFSDVMRAVHGQRAAIKVGIEKGKDGHQDKNKVADWLSPNTNSSTHKSWRALVEGNTTSANGSASSSAPTFGMSTVASPATGAIQNAPTPAAVVSGDVPDWMR